MTNESIFGTYRIWRLVSREHRGLTKSKAYPCMVAIAAALVHVRAHQTSPEDATQKSEPTLQTSWAWWEERHKRQVAHGVAAALRSMSYETSQRRHRSRMRVDAHHGRGLPSNTSSSFSTRYCHTCGVHWKPMLKRRKMDSLDHT